MKFLSKLDPMTILMLVVIFGVVITMAAQASVQSADEAATAQMVPVESAEVIAAQRHTGKS